MGVAQIRAGVPSIRQEQEPEDGTSSIEAIWRRRVVSARLYFPAEMHVVHAHARRDGLVWPVPSVLTFHLDVSLAATVILGLTFLALKRWDEMTSRVSGILPGTFPAPAAPGSRTKCKGRNEISPVLGFPSMRAD
jgi:hypothetical protein